MTVQEQRPVDVNGIIARVKALLLSPAAAWATIDEEPATVGGLYTGYAMILAAIRPICAALGGLLFGYGFWFVHYRPSVGSVLATAILEYALSLAGVYVIGLIIDALAPSFDGQKSPIQAFKVAVYSYTAAWVAGVFWIIPNLAPIGGLLGLYSLYLLYLGLPRLMKVPQAKAIGYTIVTVIAAVIVYVIIGVVIASTVGFSGMSAMRTAMHDNTGTTTVELPDALRKLSDAAEQLTQGKSNNGQPVTAVSPDALKALLPDSLPGDFKRTESQTGALLGGVHAEATYANGNKRLTLGVTDLAAAGALATLAGGFGIESDRETQTGFEKVGKINGRLTIQQWDNTSKHGKYSVLIDDRFILDAEGDANSFDDLKSAVATVGPDRVAKLR
jgi:hypothetical protein